MLPNAILRPYVTHLRVLLRRATDPKVVSDIKAALDAGPSAFVAKNLPLTDRRTLGAFFTAPKMARQLVAGLALPRTGLIVDPACGAGDLLLQIATRLRVQSTLKATLRTWGLRLGGTDIVASFVDLAAYRLALLATSRGAGGAVPSIATLRSYFPHLVCGDGFRKNSCLANARVLLLNPPYGLIQAPDGLDWARGTITAAATCVVNALGAIPDGCKIAVILPEVLRSGTRYERWRAAVTATVKDVHLSSQGRFSDDADVDVFFAIGTKGNARDVLEWTSSTQEGTTIEDLFHVHVGAVVPHRDLETGPKRRYLHSRVAQPWQVIRSYDEFRKFSGRTFKPPFVVVKRTSRPGDRFRAVGSLVLGKKPVAIENHLLVCVPRDGTQKTCRLLLRSLQDQQITDWLDQELRCRHLTVKALSSCVLRAA